MRLLIDCDPGIDDALAILLAYSTNGIQVSSITTVCGNVSVRRSTENLFKIIDALRPEEVPLIGKGNPRPIRRKPVSARGVHGKDGLADLGIALPKIQPKLFDGVQLITETLLRRDIDCVVALGPLTNLAKAIDKDPRILRRIGRLVVMGGAVHVPGNITPYAEFNFYVDPEAASFVLNKGFPLTLVSLDATQSFMLDEKDIAPLSEYKSRLGNFVNGIMRYAIKSHRQRFNLSGAYMHDPLAMAVAIIPGICEFEKLALGIEKRHRGFLAIKRGRPNALVARNPNARSFKGMFIRNLKAKIEASL